ncbi:pentatricopeptide repeat-containing protein At1g08070, chloroplastic-like [Papaver somniferum]|uniref:pentatricopeptide repeat-containing protein At1g08070, chloroplastic-like n=1 Tax=Papaver somniferum TaxID=3469 RepID=UPI000E703FC1|nr:pentatricopeptide repeat-containing protein At1g08070, chloroplastic-like [Papaver somniferum]
MDLPMKIFTHSSNPNQFAWNTIIRGFSISQNPQKALHIFIKMLRKTIEPESFTYAFVLKACAKMSAFQTGISVHVLVLKSGYGSHLFVANTMIHFYASCANLGYARKLFDELYQPNAVTWNALISGYVQNGLADEGLRVFELMRTEGIRPDDVTVIGVILACAQKKELELGRWLHGYVGDNIAEFGMNLNVWTAFIDLYGKCEQMDLARQVFNNLRRRDIGVWNALIGGYVSNGCYREALDLFQDLEMDGLDPDETTLVSTLTACRHMGDLNVGKKIHKCIEEKCSTFNSILGTALVDMYSKCGCISEARKVFNYTPKRDLMTWTSMICGLAVHGYAQDALDLYEEMLGTGLRPDGVTFVGVLCACSHAGLIDQGLHYFQSSMNTYKISPTAEHYGCIIDLLSRSGRLSEAYEIIRSMKSQPNPIIWRALLSACRVHSNVKLAEAAIENLFKLESDQSADYILLSNIYASNGRWEDVETIRRKMGEVVLRKVPGLSFV